VIIVSHLFVWRRWSTIPRPNFKKIENTYLLSATGLFRYSGRVRWWLTNQEAIENEPKNLN
jgi:hypothetical protein